MQPSRTSHVFDGNDWPMPPVQRLTSWPSKSSCQPCARSLGVSWLGGVLSGVWALALTGKTSKANARHGRNQRDCIERKRQYTRTPAQAMCERCADQRPSPHHKEDWLLRCEGAVLALPGFTALPASMTSFFERRWVGRQQRMLPSIYAKRIRTRFVSFRGSVARPPMPLSTLCRTPRDVPRKIQDQNRAAANFL